MSYPPIGFINPTGEGGPSIEAAAATAVLGTVVNVADWQYRRIKEQFEVIGGVITTVAEAAAEVAVNLWDAANSPTKPQPIGYIPPTATTSQIGYVQSTSAQGYFSFSYASNAHGQPGSANTIQANSVSLSIDKEYFTNKPWPGTTGDAIIIRGYTAAGALDFAYSLITPGPGYILFDGPVAPVITLEYLNFYWHPAGGVPELLVVQPYDFVGPSPGEEPRVPSFPLTAPVPTVLPTVVPSPQPQPEPERKVVPEIAPNTTPQPTPGPNPGPQPSPNPQTPQPATTPSPSPPLFSPVVLPQVTPNTTTQTNADGRRETAVLPGVITTPAGNEQIGPVTVTTNAPQATLAGIAGEVGRIEQKLAKMIRDPDEDMKDAGWGFLRKLLDEIAANLLTGQPAGEYILSSPCERDEQGDRIEYQVPILATNNKFAAIYERLDALADLIQTHKDLKQPICRGTQPTGQPVTVNFTQIE